MLPTGEPATLRPLSLGEIFDRSVTLYARNAALFTLIALVVVVPLAVVNYFVSLHSSGTFAQILDQIQHPAKSVPAGDANAAMGLTFLTVGVAIVLGAFVLVAISSAVGDLYRSGRGEFSSAYARTLRRAGAILLVLLCEIAGLGLVVFAGSFAMGIVLVAAFLLVRASAALGVAAFVAAAIVAVIWFLAVLLCYLAFGFAFNALGNESAGAGTAMGRGFSRIFNRTEMLRATLMCLALVAIYLGLTIVSVSIAAVFESLKLHLIEIVVSSIVSLITTSYLGVLLAVYYFDVRVRREGLDMQAQIADMPAVSSP